MLTDEWQHLRSMRTFSSVASTGPIWPSSLGPQFCFLRMAKMGSLLYVPSSWVQQLSSCTSTEYVCHCRPSAGELG